MGRIIRSGELYGKALRSLVLYPGTLQERLARAMQHLSSLRDDELPTELVPRHNALMEAMSQVDPVAGEGSFVATAQSLSYEEAAEKGEEIISIYTSVTEALARR